MFSPIVPSPSKKLKKVKELKRDDLYGYGYRGYCQSIIIDCFHHIHCHNIKILKEYE